MVMVQGSAVDTEGQEGPSPVGGRRKTRMLVAAAVAVVLVLAGGGVAYGQWISHQEQLLQDASSAYDDALRESTAAVKAAQETISASAGKVADESLREELAELVDRVPASPRGDGSRSEQMTELDEATVAVRSWNAELGEATQSVVDAQAAWELEQATIGLQDSVAQLGAAIDAGTAVLAGSEGRVADDAVRQALAAVLEAGGVLRGAEVPATVEELLAASAAVVDATAAVSGATTTVSDAQAAWQAEQDRIAAEQAAAAAAAARKASQSTASSDTKSGASGGGSSAGGGSSTKAPRLGSSSGSNFGTGTAPACTTPSCGITF